MIWLGIIIGWVLCTIGWVLIERDLKRELKQARECIDALKELLLLEKEQAVRDVNRWKCVALDKPWPEENE